MNVPTGNKERFESPIFNNSIFYEKVEVVEDEPTPIYIFHNVVINPFGYEWMHGIKETITLSGMWFPIMDYGSHYGHYIKEGVGCFIHCKERFPDLNPMFLEFMTAEPSGFVGVGKLINKLNEELLEEFGGKRYKGPIFLENRFFIEKLVIMMDNGRMFFNKQHPFFMEHMAPEVSKSLARHFKKYKVSDPSYPKKIFITRKVITDIIKKENLTSHEHFKNRYFEPWMEDAIENAFVDQGYTVIDFVNMPFEEQIKYPHNATHFASIIGTAFHNGIWCEDGTTFYGIRPNSRYLFDWKHDIVKSLNKVSWNYLDTWELKTYEEVYQFITEKLKADGES